MKRPSLPNCVTPLALFFAFSTACGDLVPVEKDSGEGDGDASSSGYNYDAEEGTCDGWKVRYCEAFVQCGYGTEAECIHQAEFVTCDQNAPYSACEADFQKVVDKDDCSLFPDDCYPRDIADRSAARKLCKDVQAAACEYDFFCGFAFNLETCITETSHLYECDQRLSAVPGGSGCVTALEKAACGDSLPEVCADHTRF